MKAFTVVANERPIVCILEESFEMAEQIFDQDYFRDDLMALENEGCPLWDGASPLRLREADAEESARAHIGSVGMRVSDRDEPSEAGALIFLVPVVDPTDDDDDDENMSDS